MAAYSLKLLCALLLPALAAGCASSSKSAAGGQERLLEKSPAIAALSPQVTASENGAGGYLFSFAVGAGGAGNAAGLTTIRNLRWFSVELFDADGQRLDSVATNDINTSGTMNSETLETSLIAAGGLEWKADAAPRPAAYAVAALHDQSTAYASRIELNPAGNPPGKTSPPLVMTLDVNSRGGQAEFVLRVRRVGPAPPGEYSPSGEKFRIVLEDDVGQQVWSSSAGMTFTQMAGPVAPTEIGKEIEYRAIWNGRDERTHMLAGPGVFRIIATLPAKPTSYVLREEFSWSGR